MEEETEEHKLCVVCCCSYSVNRQTSGWKDNSNFFSKFLKELDQPSGGGVLLRGVKKRSKSVPRRLDKNNLLNSLKMYEDQVAVCWECLEYIKEAVEMGTRTRVVEKIVTKLQKDLMTQLRKLQGCMTEYYGIMKRIEGNVTNSDVSCLESLINRQGGKWAEEELIVFRDKITEVATEMGRFQAELGNKFNSTLRPLFTSSPGATTARPLKRKATFTTQQKIIDTFNDDYDYPVDGYPDNYINEDSAEEDPNFVTYCGNSSEEDDKPDASDGSDFDFSPEVPRSRKISKISKRDLLKLIVQSVVRRHSIVTRHVAQVENPLDLPVQHRYPFVYDNSTNNMTICGAAVTLQDNQLCCSLCDFKTKTAENYHRPQKIIDSIYNHVVAMHFNAFQCQHCPKKFLSLNKYKEHCTAHKNPNSFNCNICGKPMANLESLGNHRWLHLNEEEKAEAIKNGNAPLFVRKKLKDEQTVQKDNSVISPSSTLPKTFVCKTCGKAHVSQLYLQRHEENAHMDKTVICPICGKSMKENSYRDYHQRYACPVGVYKSNAKRHQCLECKKTYQSEKSLRTHVARMHSLDAGVRPYICEVCGKGYKTDGDMKFHAKTHSQARPWKCDQCGKDFNMKRNLMRHNCSRLAATKVDVLIDVDPFL